MGSLTKLTGLAGVLMLGTALPALAQDGLCGTLGANGQWLGGDEASSDLSTSDGYLAQTAMSLANSQYVGLFTLSSATEVRLEAQPAAGGDSVIELYDANGSLVTSDDDSGGNAASLAQAYLDPGTYCLTMSAYDGSPLTGEVRVGRLEHEQLTEGYLDYDNGGDLPPGAGWPAYCDATLITRNLQDEALDGILGNGPVSVTAASSEVPFWGFTLDQARAITVTASSSAADPILVIYDSEGNWINENDDYDGLDSRIDFTSPLAAGSYCISVGAYSDSYAPITVTVSDYDPQAAVIAMYDRGEASPPLDGSHPVTALGAIDGRLRQDVMTGRKASWFSFDIAETGLIVIDAVTNSAGDPAIALFDDLGREVGYNDDAMNSLDAMLAVRVTPGTYTLGVWQVGSADTNVMTRMQFERFVPAGK